MLRFRFAAAPRWLAAPLVAAGLAAAGPGQAAPWISPGDSWLRADVQLLADAGVIRRPVNTWPLSLPDLAQDLVNLDTLDALDDAEQAALARLQRLLRAEMRIGERRYSARFGLASSPDRVRDFNDTPRGEFEAELVADMTGERIAVRAELQWVESDRADGRRLRQDGTAAAVVAGNWMLAAGWQGRHWGPGQGGSLVLGNAMRPVPGVAVQRLHSEPFELPVLEWLGPWSVTGFAGQVDGPEQDKTRLLAVRASARPLQEIELGVSSTRLTSQSGNRLAAIDVRWQPRLPGFRFAGYAQVAREQASDEIPAGNTALVGLEHWGRSERLAGNWRITLEHADTACGALVGGRTEFACAYEHSRYEAGYRHRGRPMAYGTDGDAQLTTLSVQLRRDVGDDFQLRTRFGTLNRGADPPAGNVVVAERTRFTDVEASFRREIQVGALELGAGYQRLAGDSAGTRNELRGFVRLQVNF